MAKKITKKEKVVEQAADTISAKASTKLVQQINILSQDSNVMLMMGEITTDSCQGAIEWILNANADTEEKVKQINMIICSPGGNLYDSIALVEIMRGSKIPIQTIGLGQIASAGLLIFMAGTKGKRVLTPNTTVMSHTFSTGTYGNKHELFAAQKEYSMLHERMVKLYENFTGLPEKTIQDKLLPATDVYLTAEEAKKFGICDKIVELK